MLFLTTISNPISLLNLADHLLRVSPVRAQEAADLVKVLLAASSNSSIAGKDNGNIGTFLKLKVARSLLFQNLDKLAQKLVEDIDAVSYLKSNITPEQIHLLFYVLNRTGKVKLALTLIKTMDFDQFCDKNTKTELKLKVAHELISQKLTEEARELVVGVDFESFFDSITQAGQADLCVDVLIQIGNPSKALKLLTDKQIAQRFDISTEINHRLKIAHSLILQGHKDNATTLLAEISPDTITNPAHGGLLAHGFTQLGLLNHAKKIFSIVKRKDLICKKYFLYRAILYYCLWQIDKAEECIEEEISHYGVNPSNICWRARLLNRTGRHNEAIRWLDRLLSKNGEMQINPVHSSFVHVEKGNALFSLGKFDESLKNYAKAREININATFWLWISYFEHALTLISLNKYEEALHIAQTATCIESTVYSMKYNPCNILYQLLNFKRHDYLKDSSLLKKWVNNACAWPFPFFYHKMWMLFLLAIIFDEFNESRKALNILRKLINDPIIVKPNQKQKVQNSLAKVQNWRSPQFIESLASAIWPYHDSSSFDRHRFKQLAEISF